MPRAFIVFSVGKIKQGGRNSLGVASLHKVGGLWDIGGVSSCLGPGPG